MSNCPLPLFGKIPDIGEILTGEEIVWCRLMVCGIENPNTKHLLLRATMLRTFQLRVQNVVPQASHIPYSLEILVLRHGVGMCLHVVQMVPSCHPQEMS